MSALKWTVAVGLMAGLLYWFTAEKAFNAEEIRGQRVLITGTSTGIGEELAYAFSKLGARVLITARRQNVLDIVAQRCQELGARQVIVVAGDMALADDRQRVVAEAEKAFDGKLDFLILNHVLVKHGHWNFTPDNVTTLRQAFEVNYFSYVELASLAGKMLARTGGRIGVVSSVAGKIPMAGFAYYSSIKFGLHGFFGALNMELEMAGSNVSVTMCVLGLIGTDSAIESIRVGNVKLDETLAASVEETAEAIMRGVAIRSPEIYYPFSARLVTFLHKFFPELMQRSSGSRTF